MEQKKWAKGFFFNFSTLNLFVDESSFMDDAKACYINIRPKSKLLTTQKQS